MRRSEEGVAPPTSLQCSMPYNRGLFLLQGMLVLSSCLLGSYWYTRHAQVLRMLVPG